MIATTVILDAGPLGLAKNLRMSTQSTTCLRWIQTAQSRGRRVIAPEIAAYEVRRELLCADRNAGAARINALTQEMDYLPITTVDMRLEAQ